MAEAEASVRDLLYHAGILVNRLSIGAFLFLAGSEKIRSGPEAFYVNQVSQLAPEWLPEALGRATAYTVPYLELVLSLLILAGLACRISTGIMVLVTAGTIVALAGNNLLLFPTPGTPFDMSIILLTLLILLTITGPERYSADQMIVYQRERRAKIKAARQQQKQKKPAQAQS